MYVLEFTLDGKNYLIDKNKSYKQPKIPYDMLVGLVGREFTCTIPNSILRLRNTDTGQVLGAMRNGHNITDRTHRAYRA